MKRCALFSMVTILLTTIAAVAADHRVENIQAAPPNEEISKDIAATLNDTGFQVVRGTKTSVCEIWLCKQWPAKADFKPTAEILYPFQPGELIGVVRYNRKGSDFRDQDIDKGVYTLRYAQQPIDGNHVGTSPTRDFFLLVSAEKDQSAGPMDMKKLIQASAETAESTHPSMLCLQRISGEAKAEPAMRHNEEHDWWIVGFQGTVKAGDKVSKLPVEMVIVGVAAE